MQRNFCGRQHPPCRQVTFRKLFVYIPRQFRRIPGTQQPTWDAVDAGFCSKTWWAESRIFAGDEGRAGRTCETWLATSPKDPMPRFYRGLLMRDRGDLNSAIVEFQAAADLEYVRALYWLYISSVEAGADAKSQQAIRRTAENWSANGLAQWSFMLGQVLWGNIDEARALEIAPGVGDRNEERLRNSQRELEAAAAYRLHVTGSDTAAAAKLGSGVDADDRVDLERFIHLRDIARWTATSPATRTNP